MVGGSIFDVGFTLRMGHEARRGGLTKKHDGHKERTSKVHPH